MLEKMADFSMLFVCIGIDTKPVVLACKTGFASVWDVE